MDRTFFTNPAVAPDKMSMCTECRRALGAVNSVGAMAE